MDIRDFQGVFKYKLIIPGLYIVSWLGVLLGPTFFQSLYQKFSILVIGYLVFKVITLTIIMGKINFDAYFIRNKVQERQKNWFPVDQVITVNLKHAFIIPNYNQDLEMLSETLEFLAKQRRAKSQYLIFLAMEAHEQNSSQKAKELIRRFKGRFRGIDWTLHEIREFQQKGKAANVSWCVEHLQDIFEKHQILKEDVMLTIIDADSWAPQRYFDELQAFLQQNLQRKNQIIFQAPQIFTRNNLQVPVFTRIYDLMHSYAHMSQLFSLVGITFPLSNYSISYEFVKRIGFWDTCPDAIGEDFHTTQKAYWKSGGKMFTKPIYVPFNQVNICTGKGYLSDWKARFWQGERHAQGVADAAYNIKMFFSTKFHWRNIAMLLLVFDICAMPAIIPWVFISLMFQRYIFFQDVKSSTEIYWEMWIGYLFDALSLFSGISYILLELFKRWSNTVIYRRKNQSIFRMLEYPFLITWNIFTISIPVFTIASFRVLFSKRDYVVAEKKMEINEDFNEKYRRVLLN